MIYSGLVSAIQTYTENTEISFVASIPQFVINAEERIYNQVQALATRKNDIGTAQANFPYLTLPPDWLSTFSVAVIDNNGKFHYLLNKEPDFIHEAYPPATTPNQLPIFYGLYDVDTMLLGPTPDQNYAVEINYYGFPVSIVTAGTTWLGTNFEWVLLYGALVEAYIYMKGEPEVIKLYEDKFTQAVGELKQLVDGKNRRDSYRSGQLRVQVT